MFQLKEHEIGGAIVRRTFTTDGKKLVPGQRLTEQEVLSFPTLNRMALAEKRWIDLVPKNGTTAAPEKAERFVISAGFGNFHVIEGKKLNDEALDREQAYALAGIAPPKQVRRKAVVTEKE